MTRSDVVALAAKERLMVIMPEAGLSYYTNAKYKWHSRWEDAIARELPRDVEARFHPLSGREHTGIAGISMGGYGSLKLAMKHPEHYAFAATMSAPADITQRPFSIRRWGQTWRIWSIFGATPAARRGEDIFVLLDDMPTSPTTRFFVSCGQNDPLRAVNERLVRAMRGRGLKAESMITTGGHDWQSWNASLPQLFRMAGETLHHSP